MMLSQDLIKMRKSSSFGADDFKVFMQEVTDQFLLFSSRRVVCVCVCVYMVSHCATFAFSGASYRSVPAILEQA
jgi:hypothetical protein